MFFGHKERKASMDHIGIYLKDIFSQNKRGQLLYRHGDTQKSLFFKNGDLVSARTNLPEELLNEVLFRLGKISEETYKNLESITEQGKNLGETLIESSLISDRDLEEALSNQMREIVLNLFSAFEGEFIFEERSEFLNQDFKIKLNIPLLIEEGIRRMKNSPELERFMGEVTPRPKSKSFFYRLTDDERGLLDMFRGIETSSALLQASGCEPDMFWKSLYLFYCLELVDFSLPEKRESVPEGEEKKEISDQERNIAEVLAKSENLERMDYYQLLEVTSAATQDEIKKSYFRLARKFHPDHFDREPPREIKGVIDQVFDAISKAYQVLGDEKKRADYDSKPQPVVEVEDKRNVVKLAEVKFRQGKTLYDSGRYEEAISLIEEAVRLHDKRGRYFLLLAMAQLKIPSLHKKSEENFLKAVALDQWNAEAYVGLGLLYKKEGLVVKARKQLQKALSIDPDHKVALKEMQEAGPKKRKTWKEIFEADLFKKKK